MKGIHFKMIGMIGGLVRRYSGVSQTYSECFSLGSMKLEHIWSSAELKKTSGMTAVIWAILTQDGEIEQGPV